MARPFFAKERIAYFDIYDRHAGHAINLMKQRLRNDCAIDFQDLMSRYTLDTATEYLFGQCANSLSAGLPYPSVKPGASRTRLRERSEMSTAEKFSASFAKAQYALSRRLTVGWTWPLWELWKDRTKDAMKDVNYFLDPILDNALQKHKATQGQPIDNVANEYTLLDHLVKLTDGSYHLKFHSKNSCNSRQITKSSGMRS